MNIGYYYENLVKDIPYPQEVLEKESRRAANRYYNEQVRDVTERFKQACFKELGIQDHPKKEKAFEIAWDYGHSSGYYEVYNYLETISELLK
jgi:hypothetical protein